MNTLKIAQDLENQYSELVTERAVAELRRLAALNAELVGALTLMCRSRGSPQPIPPESAYVAAYAALSKAKEI